MTSTRSEPQPPSPITVRAVVLGLLIISLLAAVNPYGYLVRKTWSVGSGPIISGAVVVLFLLVVVNGTLLRLWPEKALRRAELLVIYGMLIVSVPFLTDAGGPMVVGCTAYPFYFATPSNDWEHLIWPHIPLWLRLDDPNAVTWFWEGLPEGARTPWHAWLRPLAAWSAFTTALMAAMFCLGALLSRDWVEHQRLAFPLVEVPLAITGEETRPTLGRAIFGNRVFWMGFAVPAALATVDFLSRFHPGLPSTRIDVDLGRYFAGMGLPWSILAERPALRLRITYAAIGITCLLPTDVSLSLWLFHALFRVQQLTAASLGLTGQGGGPAGTVDPRTFIGFEEAGGFIALSGVILYQSRRAIKAAWWGLWRRGSDDDDPYGPLPGSWALLGFVLANAFMVWWAVQMGMRWWAFLVMIGFYYTVLLGASRLTSAGGVINLDTGVFARQVVLDTVGASPIGYNSSTLFTYLSITYMSDPNSVLMPQMMHSFKLIHSGRTRGRGFSLAALLAVIVMLVIGLPAMLSTVYQRGALAVPPWNPFTSYPGWGFAELESSMHAPEMPDNWLRGALVLGAGTMLGLAALSARFLWWPVSPLGYIIASSWEINLLWANVFIAWAVTTAVLRYGGLGRYRALRPAFLGLVLGQYLTGGMLSIVTSVFGLTQPG